MSFGLWVLCGPDSSFTAGAPISYNPSIPESVNTTSLFSCQHALAPPLESPKSNKSKTLDSDICGWAPFPASPQLEFGN